ncbi:hypothetical protein [Methanogenium organophilum]|uniref:Uncharacterized protein n=1 Tax=Methanogenium organophilum TaxID=2199 RepID=A0A9X9S4C7_METOG|nr:hypothetical protein [Methanogenium organophilum]WAI01769.1 hypothetical protein OU421_02530 [Methanogenium organophilum]
MDKSKKMIIVVAGLVVLCIYAAGCTTTETAGGETPTPVAETGSAAPFPDEEMPDDAPVMNTMENGSVRDDMPPDGTPEMDSEHALEMLQMLQENGVDTTEAELALENGDMDTVLAFLQENMAADMPEGGGPRERPDGEPPAEQ